MDAATLKLAKNYTNEQVVQKATNSPVEEISFDGGIYSVGNNVVNGQISDAVLKGNTWTNKAGVGDTSPQTVANLDIAKSYLLINSEGANVEIGTVDTPTPAKLTGATSFDFVWASGKIALYELSAEEATLDASVLGQKYHYVSGTKSTFPAGGTVKVVNKNLLDINYPFANINFSWVGGDVTHYQLEPNKTYTVSTNYPRNTYASVYLETGWRSSDYPLSDSNGAWLDNPRTITTDGTGKVSLALRKSQERTTAIVVTLDDLKAGLYWIQLEPGSATAFEPHKYTSASVPAWDGKSLPNGVKDEVSVTSGVKTQNTNKKVLQSSDITYQGDLSGYSWYYVDKEPDDILYGNVTASIENSLRYNLPGYTPVKDRGVVTGVGCFCNYNTTHITVSFALGTTLEQARTALTGLSLTYQLATPIVTKLPAQAPLQVFENGTVYVEPIGDASESTLPSVEMTIPTGTSNKFGVASHNYDGAAADWTLTNSESKCFMLAVSNASGAANIIAPNRPGTMYAISNASGYAIRIKKSGGTGVAVTNAKTVLVIHNGTDYTALTAEL